MPESSPASPPDAEHMAARASDAMRRCLKDRSNFRVEAGAGAGKTHALVEALRWLVENRGESLSRSRAQVACITYTNVAVAEITERLGSPPTVWVSTIHSFLWHLISPFQKALREELAADARVVEKLEGDAPPLDGQRVAYNEVGRLRITETEVAVSHDQVISLAGALLSRSKFRKIWLSKFPVLLLDEYQDTNLGLMTAIREHLLSSEPAVQMGLFGDHWQKIYDGVCGLVEDQRIQVIPKGANFRSCTAVVNVLNRIRPELPQAVSREMAATDEHSEVLVFHTNSWPDSRGKGHYKNALNDDAQDSAVILVRDLLRERGWNVGEESTGVLRLTNKAVARSEGFAELLTVFRYADDLLRQQDAFIEVLAERVEPAAELAASGRRTAALEAVGWAKTGIRAQADKRVAREWLDALTEHRERGTVADVIEHLQQAGLLSTSAEKALGDAMSDHDEEESDRTTRLRELWTQLKVVPYEQVRRWYAYHSGNTMLSTKHGVKGAQFDEVVVVFGGGWSKYDFPRMLDEWGSPEAAEAERFARARNLFYVTVSRARHRLALVFLKTLPPNALKTLRTMFGEDAVLELPRSAV